MSCDAPPPDEPATAAGTPPSEAAGTPPTEATKSPPGNAAPAPPLVDAAGRLHTPAPAGARIASLVPSLTELLFDLGLGDQVVARTAFCVHPKDGVRRVRSVGGTKTINRDKLTRTAPTHVLVNVDETPKALADDLAAAGYTVVVTHPIEVADNLALFQLIGRLFGREAEAADLCRRFAAAYARTQAAAAERPPRRVLYLIWKEPWMTVAPATYISRMLALAGLVTVPVETATRYPEVDVAPLLDDVDLVLFATEPFPFQEHHLAAFRAAFPRHADKVRLIDAEMVSWYGSRAIAGLDYLTAFAAGLDDSAAFAAGVR